METPLDIREITAPTESIVHHERAGPKPLRNDNWHLWGAGNFVRVDVLPVRNDYRDFLVTAMTVTINTDIETLTIAILVEQGEGFLEFSNLLFSKLISHGV